jgi:transcription elongation factor GreA
MSQIPVTVEGKQKLQTELQALEATVPQIQSAIKEAREHGDLKENAEYHAAREELGMANAKIAELRDKLARSVVVDLSMIDTSKIAFGATIQLQDQDDGSIEEWFLVGEGEEDPLDNKILTSSPMGQALLGHAVGDEITVQAPMGDLRFKVQKISYGN